MTAGATADPPRRALVVGAGIAGLGAAVLLARRGVDVELWEASEDAGGLLAPVSFGGLEHDRGAHRVHPTAHPLLVRMTREAAWTSRRRDGRLVIGGRHVRYPVGPLDLLRGLGAPAAAQMGLGLLLRPGRLHRYRRWSVDREPGGGVDHGFEQFVIARVGRAAYRRFYRPYAVKVWGEPPSRLSQSMAKQRVATSDPVRALLGRVTGRGRGERFLYPRRGMAELVRALHREARALGVRVHFDRRWDPRARPSADGPVLYSGHLPDLAPEAELRHAGLYLLHLAFPADAVDAADTWYVPDPAFWFGRVSQPARFSPALAEGRRTVLCVEIPEGRWGPDRDFASAADAMAGQLFDAGVLRRRAAPLEARQTFIPRVYPVYVRGWQARWRRAMDRAASLGGVLPVGRQGLYLHCNMDQALATAADAVEHLLAGGDAAGWAARCDRYLGLRVRD